MKDLYKKENNNAKRIRLLKLTESLLEDIELNREKQSWVDICCNYKLTDEFIRKYKDVIIWGHITILPSVIGRYNRRIYR